jgi:5-methylcytosine-specific restriction protein A
MQYCHRPGCSVLVERGYCRTHAPKDRDRANAAVRQWYFTKRWRAMRARCLVRHPVCRGRGDGIPCGLPTTDADHRVPHRGDPALFWDEHNLEGKCHRCHSSKSGRGQ